MKPGVNRQHDRTSTRIGSLPAERDQAFAIPIRQPDCSGPVLRQIQIECPGPPLGLANFLPVAQMKVIEIAKSLYVLDFSWHERLTEVDLPLHPPGPQPGVCAQHECLNPGFDVCV